jgi:protein-S-isoprenylcysteine O-methyltransferase Ste14
MTETQNKWGGARVRVPPPLVFLTGVCGGALIDAFAWPLPFSFGRAARLTVASVVGLVGLLLMASTISWFRRTGQDPQPWKPTPELIARGPYRFCRNPMYIGMSLLQGSAGLFFDRLWILLLVVPALVLVHFTAVLPEERYLAERFGDAYRAYLASVPRYLGWKSTPTP